MMKSKYVLVLAAIAAVLMIGLVAAVSVNSAVTAGSSEQQSISTNTCPFAQPASQQISDDGCCKSKKKCDPNSKEGGCKKKADPNCTK